MYGVKHGPNYNITIITVLSDASTHSRKVIIQQSFHKANSSLLKWNYTVEDCTKVLFLEMKCYSEKLSSYHGNKMSGIYICHFMPISLSKTARLMEGR